MYFKEDSPINLDDLAELIFQHTPPETHAHIRSLHVDACHSLDGDSLSEKLRRLPITDPRKALVFTGYNAEVRNSPSGPLVQLLGQLCSQVGQVELLSTPSSVEWCRAMHTARATLCNDWLGPPIDQRGNADKSLPAQATKLVIIPACPPKGQRARN